MVPFLVLLLAEFSSVLVLSSMYSVYQPLFTQTNLPPLIMLMSLPGLCDVYCVELSSGFDLPALRFGLMYFVVGGDTPNPSL